MFAISVYVNKHVITLRDARVTLYRETRDALQNVALVALRSARFAHYRDALDFAERLRSAIALDAR